MTLAQFVALIIVLICWVIGFVLFCARRDNDEIMRHYLLERLDTAQSFNSNKTIMGVNEYLSTSVRLRDYSILVFIISNIIMAGVAFGVIK